MTEGSKQERTKDRNKTDLDLLADEGKLGIIQFENALVLDSLSASGQCTNNLFLGDGTVSVSGEHIAVTVGVPRRIRTVYWT